MPRSSAEVQEIFRPSQGSAMIEELPRVTETGASSVKYSRSLSCSTGSPCRIRFTKGRAEPSMIGGSRGVHLDEDVVDAAAAAAR